MKRDTLVAMFIAICAVSILQGCAGAVLVGLAAGHENQFGDPCDIPTEGLVEAGFRQVQGGEKIVWDNDKGVALIIVCDLTAMESYKKAGGWLRWWKKNSATWGKVADSTLPIDERSLDEYADFALVKQIWDKVRRGFIRGYHIEYHLSKKEIKRNAKLKTSLLLFQDRESIIVWKFNNWRLT